MYEDELRITVARTGDSGSFILQHRHRNTQQTNVLLDKLQTTTSLQLHNMSYASYAASVSKESPFKLYSQSSFSTDLGDLVVPDLPTHRQRLRLKPVLIAVALLLAVAIGTMCIIYMPVQGPAHWSISTHQLTAQPLQAPTATIRCQIQRGSSSISSACSGDVEYADGRQQHITIWQQQPVTTQAAPLDDGNVAAAPYSLRQQWETLSGKHRRQQHRKLVHFQ